MNASMIEQPLNVDACVKVFCLMDETVDVIIALVAVMTEEQLVLARLDAVRADGADGGRLHIRGAPVSW